jgi:hypothetical protein
VLICSEIVFLHPTGVASQTARTFFVESYVPRLDARTAETLSSRLRETIRQLNEEGAAVRWRGSFALVNEETYICIIAAPMIGDVIEVSERAGLDHDNVVEALTIDAPAIPDN